MAYERSRTRTAPACPNCRETRGAEVAMRGPMPDPTGRSDDRFFVCESCNYSMKDRRKGPRQEAT